MPPYKELDLVEFDFTDSRGYVHRGVKFILGELLAALENPVGHAVVLNAVFTKVDKVEIVRQDSTHFDKEKQR